MALYEKTSLFVVVVVFRRGAGEKIRFQQNL